MKLLYKKCACYFISIMEKKKCKKERKKNGKKKNIIYLFLFFFSKAIKEYSCVLSIYWLVVRGIE